MKPITTTVVTHENFDSVLNKLRSRRVLALDTETTGLRPYHGDRLFAVILATRDEAFYFNFNTDNAGSDWDERVLNRGKLLVLDVYIFQQPLRIWYMQNAKFDLAMLWQQVCSINGVVWCTLSGGRLLHSDRVSYSLEAQARTIGEKKLDTVERYIQENGLWEWVQIPGKNKREKRPFYNKVPFDVMVPYGGSDGVITFRLGEAQRAELRKRHTTRRPGTVGIGRVLRNELAITKTCFAMEERGLLLDVEFTKRAIEYEKARQEKLRADFKLATSCDFQPSPTLFKMLWGERSDLARTAKGNLCFDADAIETLAKNGAPGAQSVLALRQAKSRLDYYYGFLYHADANNVIHTHFNQAGTKTGRFSSSDPNFQNLEKPDEDEIKTDSDVAQYIVRRAIVPRPGYVFFIMDMDQAEYRLLLDYAGARGLISKVLSGLDVHQATADVAGITRRQAKTANFAKLYGSGIRNLAAKLGVTLAVAKEIVLSIDNAAPEIAAFIRMVTQAAEARGYITNWLGRQWHLTDYRFAYRGTNALIQGGVGDIVKVAMNKTHERLRGTRSALVLNVHDELVFELHESELDLAPELHAICESVFPHRFLPLTWGKSWSAKSLADKNSGLPGTGSVT